MTKITSFDWDNLDNIFITEDEDPAYAGDKVPNSSDDQECGDGFVPKWKDCHDGDAHRPSPGENPYWTDDNSAEKRNEKDIPWDTNKPKSREERDKETEYHEPEEVEDVEPEIEEQVDDEAALEAVPDKQWNHQIGKVNKSLIALSTMYANLGIGSSKFQELWDGLEPLKEDDRIQQLRGVQILQKGVHDAEQILAGPERAKLKNPEFYDLEVKKAAFAVDMLNGSIKKQDPRDIQVWDKILNRPETLEVEDLLQLSSLRKVDLDNLKPAEEQYAQSEITRLKATLDKWKEMPTVGGAYLAQKFVDPPRRLGWSKDDLIQESPFETNPQLALAILDRSARAGDNHSNKALWEQFGLNEEWHPSSFLFDELKSIEKATKEMKQMADWSAVDKAQQDMMMAGVGLAEAEDALEEFQPGHDARVQELVARKDSGKIDSNTYTKLMTKLQNEIDPYVDAVWNAKKQINKAGKRVMDEAEKLRQPIKDALKKLNQYNRIDPETEGNLLHRAGNAEWADINEDDDDYKARPGQGRAGLSGARLLTLRKKARANSTGPESSAYPNKDAIVETLQDFLSIAHKDLVSSPRLQDITWTAEVFERAYADPNKNTLCLSVNPQDIGKGKAFDRARTMSKEPLDRPDVAIHEFAHHIEFANQDIAKRMEDFYKRRTGDGKIIRKGDIDPRTGRPYIELSHFDDNESFKDDHFFDMYCGKYYGDSETREAIGRDGTQMSELVSMGMQVLYNKAQWGLMVRDDPQHLALIIAALRGY
jgi:hypothetical protein